MSRLEEEKNRLGGESRCGEEVVHVLPKPREQVAKKAQEDVGAGASGGNQLQSQARAPTLKQLRPDLAEKMLKKFKTGKMAEVARVGTEERQALEKAKEAKDAVDEVDEAEARKVEKKKKQEEVNEALRALERRKKARVEQEATKQENRTRSGRGAQETQCAPGSTVAPMGIQDELTRRYASNGVRHMYVDGICYRRDMDGVCYNETATRR